MRDERGLTLVEMLAVLAILSVAAGATALSLGGPRDGGARVEAVRLAEALQLASDEAVVADVGGQVTLDAAGWRVADGRHALGEGVSLRGPEAIALGPDAPDAAVALEDGEERWTVRFDGLTAVAARDGG